MKEVTYRTYLVYRPHSGVCFTCVGNTTWEATEKQAVQGLRGGISSLATTTHYGSKTWDNMVTLILLMGPVKPVATLARWWYFVLLLQCFPSSGSFYPLQFSPASSLLLLLLLLLLSLLSAAVAAPADGWIMLLLIFDDEEDEEEDEMTTTTTTTTRVKTTKMMITRSETRIGHVQEDKESTWRGAEIMKCSLWWPFSRFALSWATGGTATPLPGECHMCALQNVVHILAQLPLTVSDRFTFRHQKKPSQGMLCHECLNLTYKFYILHLQCQSLWPFFLYILSAKGSLARFRNQSEQASAEYCRTRDCKGCKRLDKGYS